MGKLKERYFPEGLTAKEYCKLIRAENIIRMQEEYASCISVLHTDTAKEFDMTDKQILMFGWQLCLAYQYGGYDDYEDTEWFQEFKRLNHLSQQ